MRFPNLAGGEREKNNEIILREMERTGVMRARKRQNGEVQTNWIGLIPGKARLARAWYYWMVDCRYAPVPLDIANRLYADPVGKTDIRANGDCACRPPEDWAIYYDEKGYRLVDAKEEEVFKRLNIMPDPRWRFVADPKAEGKGYVNHYHIDSELGLRLFVDAMQEVWEMKSPPVAIMMDGPQAAEWIRKISIDKVPH